MFDSLLYKNIPWGGMILNLNSMSAAATLHCLSGCAIGEIIGLLIGAAAGLSNLTTVVISIALAFVFGYTLSLMPLINGGLTLRVALSIALAADTLSIATMEMVDNAIMLVIPNAMNATIVNPTFWWSLGLSLIIAFFAALPVNDYLIKRGKGHALAHQHHH